MGLRTVRKLNKMRRLFQKWLGKLCGITPPLRYRSATADFEAGYVDLDVESGSTARSAKFGEILA